MSRLDETVDRVCNSIVAAGERPSIRYLASCGFVVAVAIACLIVRALLVIAGVPEGTAHGINLALCAIGGTYIGVRVA